MSENGVLDKSPAELTEADIIYDWNALERRGARSSSTRSRSSTRRCATACSLRRWSIPKIEDKLKILNLMNDVGIDHVDIGLPGAGKRALEDVLELGARDPRRQAAHQGRPAPRARIVADIQPIVEISQKLGMPIEVMAFIGSSPIRLYAEDWNLDFMLKQSAEAIDLAVKNGLPVHLRHRGHDALAARGAGGAVPQRHRARRARASASATPSATPRPTASRTCSSGRATSSPSMGVNVGIDWHGHNDRGLGVTNTIIALEYGADRAHGTILGIGERVGNASLDQILINLKLLGELPDHDLIEAAAARAA